MGGIGPEAHALVLAAGAGRRFGGAKLLARYRGRPLLAHVLAAVMEAIARGSLRGGHVVVAPGAREIAALVREAELEPVENADPGAGLAGSLRAGLAALGRLPLPVAGAAVVFLGDQPLVRPDVVDALVAAWRERGAAAVRPRYAARPGEPGHPVLLDRSLWPLAERLEGDGGFGPLLAGSPAVLTLDLPGDNPDVDTPADLLGIEEASR